VVLGIAPPLHALVRALRLGAVEKPRKSIPGKFEKQAELNSASPRSPIARHALVLFKADLFLTVLGYEAPVIIAPGMPSPRDPVDDARR